MLLLLKISRRLLLLLCHLSEAICKLLLYFSLSIFLFLWLKDGNLLLGWGLGIAFNWHRMPPCFGMYIVISVILLVVKCVLLFVVFCIPIGMIRRTRSLVTLSVSSAFRWAFIPIFQRYNHHILWCIVLSLAFYMCKQMHAQYEVAICKVKSIKQLVVHECVAYEIFMNKYVNTSLWPTGSHEIVWKSRHYKAIEISCNP